MSCSRPMEGVKVNKRFRLYVLQGIKEVVR